MLARPPSSGHLQNFRFNNYHLRLVAPYIISVFRDYEQRAHKNLKQAVIAVDGALFKQLSLQLKRAAYAKHTIEAREGRDANRPHSVLFYKLASALNFSAKVLDQERLQFWRFELWPSTATVRVKVVTKVDSFKRDESRGLSDWAGKTDINVYSVGFGFAFEHCTCPCAGEYTVSSCAATGVGLGTVRCVIVTDDDGIVCHCSGQSEGLVCSHGFAIMIYVAQAVHGVSWLSKDMLPQAVMTCVAVFGRTVWILGTQNHAAPVLSSAEAASITDGGMDGLSSATSSEAVRCRAAHAKEAKLPATDCQKLSVYLHRALSDLQSRGSIELTAGVLEMIDMLTALSVKARSSK